MIRAAHWSTVSTRKPSKPSRIWSVIPPARPPTTGRPFHSASLTVSPKPFADRLLDHDAGDALERVDLHRADLVQVRQQVDVAVAGPGGLGVLPDLEALGVVGGHRPGEHELCVGHLRRAPYGRLR